MVKIQKTQFSYIGKKLSLFHWFLPRLVYKLVIGFLKLLFFNLKYRIMKKSLFFLLLFLAAFTLKTGAQSTSWTGTTDTIWNNLSNWTAGVPSSTIDAVIGDISFVGPNEPTINTAVSCKGLTIKPGLILHVATSSDITVTGGLTNDGTISGDSVSINFEGNSTVNGSGTTIYDNFKLAAGANITLNNNIEVSGDLIVDGTLTGTGKTVTFSGSTSSTIRGSGTISLGNVVQNKISTSLTLLAPITITGALTLTNGIINTTSANLLTMANDATSTAGNANSFVNGPMKKVGNDAFVFPLGNNGVWARLGISAPALPGDAFTAQYFANSYSNTDSLSSTSPVLNNVSKVEYWNCERTAGTSDVTVQLFWEDPDRSGISDYNEIMVAHWNGTEWENQGRIGITPMPQGDVTSTMQSSFSPFTFGSVGGNNVLPITLLNFNARLNPSRQVNLAWETASETNNDYFAIERSQDGSLFEVIAKVEGAGNSTLKNNYSYVDEKPFEGVSYYRLRQTDHNGAFTYSKINTLEIKKAASGIEVFPNPMEGQQFVVSFQDNAGPEVQVALYNTKGEKVFSRVFPNEDQSAWIVVEMENKLSPGIYSILATSDNTTYRKKIFIK